MRAINYVDENEMQHPALVTKELGDGRVDLCFVPPDGVIETKKKVPHVSKRPTQKKERKVVFKRSNRTVNVTDDVALGGFWF